LFTYAKFIIFDSYPCELNDFGSAPLPLEFTVLGITFNNAESVASNKQNKMAEICSCKAKKGVSLTKINN